MSLHDSPRRNWRQRLVAVSAAASCLIGISAVSASAQAASATPPAASNAVRSSAIQQPSIAASRAAAIGNVCDIMHYKTSGNGSAKHPCNYNIHHNAADEVLQYLNTRTYDRLGNSVLVSYVVGYANSFSSNIYPYAPQTHTALFVEITQILCLNAKTHSVGCGYLNIVMREHHFNKNYDLQFRCDGGQKYVPCRVYANGGVTDQGKLWSFGSGFFQDDTRHMTHWGGIAYLSAIVNGHYIPNNGYTVGTRHSAYWRARLHVHY